MENSQEDKDIDSLEGSANETSQVPNAAPADGGSVVVSAPKKEKINKRLQNLITKVNIYLLLFILIMVLAAGVVIVSMQRSKKESAQENLAGQELTTEELKKIGESDAKVGDPKQTLTIESNAIFSGKVLVRDSLDVAGGIKVGTALNVPGIAVSGDSSFGRVAANELTVAGNTSVQGQFNVRGNAAFGGTGSFGGTLSAPQINIQTLQISGDLSFGRHLNPGGGTPTKNNGTALGSGGTSSISGTDTAGTLSINTGGGPGAGCFATIIFSQRFSETPHVVVTPIGSPAGNINFYVNRSNTSFSICTSNPPPSGASFAFDYIVIE